MATITSAATGNWSAGATWVGGVVPGVNDRAVIAAGHIVNLNVDATVQGVSGASASTNRLDITTSRTLTCTIDTIFQKSFTNSGIFIQISGTGITVNINANLYLGGSNGSNVLTINSVCTVNIVGNVTGDGSATGTANAINITNAATVNITGNVACVSLTNGTYNAIVSNAGCTLNITGNVTGAPGAGTANGVAAISNLTSVCTINVTGNCTSFTGHALVSTVSSIITVVGTITASNSANGINVSSCTISTPCINSANGRMAVLASTTKIYSTSVASWLFKDESNNDKFLYSAGVALGNPVIANVRDGTVYGASNELTGSLIMAIPANVRRGVPTDATVGTADLTAQDIFTEIASSSDPIAVRLRNTATVQTTGAQLASYN